LIERIYYNTTDFISLELPEDGSIGISMSGGADSSLLAYLLVRSIQKNNLPLKIFPVTAELLRRPYNLKHASNVVRHITEVTGFKFDLHLSYHVPNHISTLTDAEKDRIHSTYVERFKDLFGFRLFFTGNTSNPPIEMVPNTHWAERPPSRDNPKWRAHQNAEELRAPFIDVDKKVIAALYKKYDLLKSLFPLTRSCEAELVETKYFTEDCFTMRPLGEECWWCCERAYGFGDLRGKAKIDDRKSLLY